MSREGYIPSMEEREKGEGMLDDLQSGESKNRDAKLEMVRAQTNAYPLLESVRSYGTAISFLKDGELPPEYQEDLVKARKLESEIRERVSELTTLFRDLQKVN